MIFNLGVCNQAIMNDVVHKSKRYENVSLSYTGIDKHSGENIGLYDTVISIQDFQRIRED